MHRLLFALLLCSTVAHSLAQSLSVFIVSTLTNRCLTIGGDSATLQLFTCRDATPTQKWDVYQGQRVQSSNMHTCLDSALSSNAGAVQSWACNGLLSQNWVFEANGQLVSGGKCLTVLGNGNEQDMFLMNPCDPNNPRQKFATSIVVPVVAAPQTTPQIPQQTTPQIPQQTTPQIPQQTTPQIPQTTPQIPQQTTPQIPQQTTPQTPPATLPTIGDITNPAGVSPTAEDHYLCVCLSDKDDGQCVDAVKAACMVGHIPSADCEASFNKDNHDGITSHITRLIENGAKCNDPNHAGNLEGGLLSFAPGKFASQTTVTKGDHYLCVCLEEGKDKSEACVDAVKAACVVGHIPAGDCFASFKNNQHDNITDRIYKIIDAGASCPNHYTEKSTKTGKVTAFTCPDPPCFGDPQDTPTSYDHYLCVCMDDYQSTACANAVKKACKLGHIPGQDCDVAEKGYHVGVTRHMLHLIDHGANCGAKKSMHFTNHGCHCKQSWTGSGGMRMDFPNNCGDPKNEKGFPWCETVDHEQCMGKGGIAWDRCDNPKRPKYIPSSSSASLDHYLCVCIEDNAASDVCSAAVKAACMVGHLPAKNCKESFSNNDHSKISDDIAKIISYGAQCETVASSLLDSPDTTGSTKKQAKHPSPNTVLKTKSSSKGRGSHAHTETKYVPKAASSLPRYCGHGKSNGGDACVCDEGYAGSLCERCASGFFNYPKCQAMVQCPGCKNGSCDYTTGKCMCPANFAGPTCSECATGYSTETCIPTVLVPSRWGGHTAMVVVSLALVGACGWYLKTRYSLGKRRKGYFDRVPEWSWLPALRFDGDDPEAMEEFTKDVETPVASIERTEHTGLAI